MGSEHMSLLYYCTLRWLSRCNVLSRTFELRQRIYIFLQEEEHKYTVYFVNEELLIKLSYLGLCGIFEKLCDDLYSANRSYLFNLTSG